MHYKRDYEFPEESESVGNSRNYSNVSNCLQILISAMRESQGASRHETRADDDACSHPWQKEISQSIFEYPPPEWKKDERNSIMFMPKSPNARKIWMEIVHDRYRLPWATRKRSSQAFFSNLLSLPPFVTQNWKSSTNLLRPGFKSQDLIRYIRGSEI